MARTKTALSSTNDVRRRSYWVVKAMASRAPLRSSSCMAAQSFPSLLRRRWMPVRIPQRATSTPLSRPSSVSVSCDASSELLSRGPIGEIGQGMVGWRIGSEHFSEESALTAGSIFPGAQAGLDGAVHDSEKLGAVAFERIHGAGLDQAFDNALV